METTMIISMNDYRRLDEEYDASSDVGHDLRRRAYEYHGNAAPALQLATVESGLHECPDLPTDFDDFDAKDFIARAYALATQI